MSKGDYSIPEIEKYIENTLEAWGVPGGAAAIIDDGEVVSSRGYGLISLGADDPVNGDTRFAIGSCTKAFVAAGLGLLVDEGKMNWDDRVSDYLVDFTLYDTWITKNVTIRDLLCHRTGLRRSIRLMQKDQVFDDDDYYRRIRYLTPAKEFRASFGYNNTHYLIAGKIIESVSGVTWNNFIEERIFTPLGMRSSVTTYTAMMESKTDNISSPHANLNGGLLPGAVRMLDPVEPITWTDYGTNAAGSIISTVKDMSTWILMLLNYGVSDGRQILPPSVVEELISPQMLIKPEDSDMGIINAVGIQSNFLSYGLGWYVGDYRGDRIIFHDGQIHGFSSAVAYIPERRVGGIFLLNSYHTMAHPMLGYDLFDKLEGVESDYSSKALEMIKQFKICAEAKKDGIVSSRREGIPPSMSEDNYIGVFESDLFGPITVFTGENNGLLFQYGNSDLNFADLEHWEGDTFLINYRNRIYDTEFLRFVLDEKKNVTALVIDQVDTFIKRRG